METRIKQIRKVTGLTQEQFAKRLGLSRNHIAQVETRKGMASDRTIKDICREFNINEEWLRFGIGSMKKQPNDEIVEIMNNVLTEDNSLYSLIKGILKTYNEADDTSKQCLEEFAETLLTNLKNDTTILSSSQKSNINKRVSAYRDYLEIKEKAMEKSSS